jgi:signal transduction histidine kinase/DNA-binding response OmpR family regulator
MQTKKTSLEQKLFSWLASGVVMALVIATGFVAYALVTGRNQYIASAKESSKTIADLLQANLFASTRDIDLALRQAEVEFQRLHAQRRFDTETFSAYVRGLKERIPDAASIRGANAEGLVVFGESIDPQHIVLMSATATGKEMFEHAQTERGVVFGLPVKSRISGLRVLPVARALRFADGRFGGMVYASVNIEKVSGMFSALSAGTHGEVTLFDPLRRVLHQSPASESTKAGKPFVLDPDTERALRAGNSVDAYLSSGAEGGPQYIAKVNAIAPYPVFVAVRLDMDEVLAQWHSRARSAVVSLLILYAMAGLMLLAVKRAMHRQQLAQDQAQRQSLLLDEVINQLPFGVVAYDENRTMRLSNSKFGELMQFPPALLQREALSFADVVRYAYARGDLGYTESEDVVLNHFVGLMEARQNIFLERLQANGSYIEIRGTPIFSNWTLLTYTDISAHKASEQSLQAAREAADAANQVKSDFLATMSHEIRTPMNGVLGMLKLLQHTELSRRQLDYTKKAEGATHALLGIINDILDFSKVEDGKLELHNEPVVLGELMRDLSVVLSSGVANKDVEVLFALAADVPPVLICDALRLRQILLNLTGNALKFTEQGEVVLGIRVLECKAEQAVLEFSVRDTGIGIPADKAEHIFEAFHQAESSTTRRFGGTGLGLAISRQLVALMGGTLSLISTVGQGSRFYFSVPFAIGPAALLLTPLVPAGRGLRVLIVDDNALARKVLQEMASSMGWAGEALDSGEAALQRLDEGGMPGYDLVLMDWRMPGMDGWETTRRIRQLKRNGKSPVVIMVTALGRELLAEKAKHETDLLDGYLVKPVTASMLYEAVADALDDRRGERRLHLPQQAGQRLRGLRLLVVEDNLLNQQIAQELLQRNGAAVAVAVCGLDGVAQGLAAQPPFDAILMDMQMPDIDGLEATRRLRSHAAMQAVPIIAMTANARPADRQACMDAGMVDHVSKPFDLEHLIASILRHVPARQADWRQPAPMVNARADPRPPVIDLQGAVGRLGGSRAFYDKVVASFRVEAALQWANLQGVVSAADCLHALYCVHTLKGLAGTIGAMGLAVQAAHVEAALNPWQDAVSAGQPTVAQLGAITDLLQLLGAELATTLDALDGL